MLGPPDADPINIRRTAEVVPIGRLGQPAALTGRLARPPALRLAAIGRCTLASASILLADLPAATSKELPCYPSAPAVRMGRLAIDRGFRGQGLGGALLADGLERAARSEIAAFSLVVDAKDESAAAFYRHHSFIALPDSPLTLFLPLATVPLSFRGLGAN